MTDLTKKNQPFVWTDNCKEAFSALKDLATSEPALIQPDLERPFEMEVDASGYATGAVLIQRDELGKPHPVTYLSQTLNEAERGYNITNLELLAIMRGFCHWRHFLANADHKVIVHTDHANLLYFQEPHKINRRIARYVLELEEFNFEL